MHVALPKRPTYQLKKSVQGSRQQVLRAYCPNMYIVPFRRTHIASRPRAIKAVNGLYGDQSKAFLRHEMFWLDSTNVVSTILLSHL